jgi:hypothetical protein
MGAASAPAPVSLHRSAATRHGLDEWRRMRLPDWPAIFREAATHDDEHDLSLGFSAGEESKRYGDPLYKYAAAKRPNLI